MNDPDFLYWSLEIFGSGFIAGIAAFAACLLLAVIRGRVTIKDGE